MDYPKETTVCNLEVVVMPNGEIICSGKTIGWFKELGKYLSPKEAQKVVKKKTKTRE